MNKYPWVATANKLFLGILIVQAVASIIGGIIVGQTLMSLLMTVGILSVPLFLLATKPYETLTHHAVGVATQLFTALHIQLAMGLTEIHFEIFTLLAFLAWYRNWRLFISSVAVIAVHHVGFFVLQLNGMPFYIFEGSHMMWMMVFTHAFFAVSEGTVLGIMSNHNYKEAIDNLRLKQSVEKILDKRDIVDLSAGKEHSDPKSPFYNFVTAVHTAITTFNMADRSVGDSSKKLADINNEVKKTTDESVIQIATISSAVDQMTATISDVARQTNEASQYSNEALQNTEQTRSGVSVAKDTVVNLSSALNDMNRIVTDLDSKTKQITEVMSSIQAVADQTNLLALNAAIEAARAGEHGRGFAVVADEVRALASNTKDSTDRIQEVSDSIQADSKQSVQILQTCLQLCDESTEASEGAYEKMVSLDSLISRVADNIISVATAAEQQVMASEEIARTTVMLRDIAENNDKNVSESFSATEKLTEALQRAQNVMKQFRV